MTTTSWLLSGCNALYSDNETIAVWLCRGCGPPLLRGPHRGTRRALSVGLETALAADDPGSEADASGDT